jgi:hypothetical protein
MLYFARQVNLGRGFATQVIDLSQPKHRQQVSGMDLNPETGIVTITPTEQMGIMNKVPRPLHFKEWVHCVEAEPVAKGKKDA